MQATLTPEPEATAASTIPAAVSSYGAIDSGLYYEGAVRAGYLKGDFHGMIAKSMSRYDSGAPYIAAQAGLGKIYTRNRDSYDIYGKFLTPTSEATAPSSTAATVTRSTISTPSIPMSPDSA